MLAKLEEPFRAATFLTFAAVSGLVPAPVVRAAVGTLLLCVFIFFTGVAAVLITILLVALVLIFVTIVAILLLFDSGPEEAIIC